MKTHDKLRRLVVFILCATMVVGLLPMTVFADMVAEANATLRPSQKVNRAIAPVTYVDYIIQLVAGERGYTGNGTIEVTYTDYYGKSKSVTVDIYDSYLKLFPENTYKKITDGHELIQDVHKRGMASSSNMAYEINGIAKQFTGAYSVGMGGQFDLRPYGSCTLPLSRIAGNIESVDSVKVTLKDQGSLSLQSLRIIEVDRDNEGRYFNGTLSGQLEGRWRGYVLAEGSGTCSGGKKSTVFSESEYNLKCYAGNKRPYVDNEALICQGISFHIADEPTAGIETLLADVRTEFSAETPEWELYFNGSALKQLGVEAFRAYENLNPIFSECLNLEVTYLDVLGATRKVEIPAVTLYLVQILCDNEGKLYGQNYPLYSTWISGIFQQNETIALVLCLAQYKSLLGIQLTYGEAPDGIVSSIFSEEYRRVVDTKNDTLAIDELCFYEDVSGKEIQNRYSEKHLTCLPTLPEKTAYSYTSTNIGGAELETGYKLPMTLENGKLVEGPPVKKPLKDIYVVELQNSDVDGAGTYNNVYMDIAYVDINGFEQVLENLSLKELVGQFYGYTCKEDSQIARVYSTLNESDFSYDGDYFSDHLEMDRYLQYWASIPKSSSVIRFAISVTNVNHFTSITFTLQNEGTEVERRASGQKVGLDNWQLRSLTIKKATSIGQRYSSKGRSLILLKGYPDIAFPRWQRDVEGDSVAWGDQTMLLQSGVSSLKYDLTYKDQAGNIIEPENPLGKNEKDYLYEIPTSMTYEETLKQLGLIVPKFTYNVTVAVGKLPDAGSTNHFYFQCIFENGTSGVVLANQQLSADGFREGSNSQFQIRTAQNYGALKSLRIICDSASSVGDVYDKLNIENVLVTLIGTTGVSRTWEIGNGSIGWIDINYSEEGVVFDAADPDVIAPNKITNEQLVKEYPVTGITTTVDLEFSIVTAADSSFDIRKVEANGIQAELVYFDTAGFRKTWPLPEKNSLIAAIRSYNGTDDTTGVFSRNHIDHFQVSIPNVSSIHSLKITRSDGGQVWKVARITIQQVGGGGRVILKDNNEYMRIYDTTKELAESDQVASVGVDPNGTTTFNFSPHTISVNQSEDSSWDVTISREPTTTNDVANIYLHYGKSIGQDRPFVDGMQIEGSLKYYTIYNSFLQNTCTFQVGTRAGETIMYAENVSVNGMATLQAMTLKDKSGKGDQAVVDHAVVEQVRGDVIVNTYRLDYGLNLSSSIGASPTGSVDAPMWQKITLMSEPGQSQIDLTPEQHDVAVALRYTSSNGRDGHKKVYQSPYIYLTDQDIMALSSQQNVELTFNVSAIDEIVGFSVVTTGPVFHFSGAAVWNYDARNDTVLGSYRTDKKFGASKVATVVSLDQGDTSSATFTFVTPGIDEVAGAGTSGKVSMTVQYTDADGNAQTRHVSDLISMLPNGSSLAAGTTVQLKMLLPGAVDIEGVTLHAQDDDWYVSRMGVILERSDGTTIMNKAVQVDGWTKPLTPLEVDLNAKILSLSVSAYSEAMMTTTSSGGGAALQTTARIGDTITLTPLVGYTGSLNTTCSWETGEWAGHCQLMLDGRLVFHVPEDAQDGQSYQVTVSSRADSNFRVTITIVVAAAEVAEPT